MGYDIHSINYAAALVAVAAAVVVLAATSSTKKRRLEFQKGVFDASSSGILYVGFFVKRHVPFLLHRGKESVGFIGRSLVNFYQYLF